MIGLYLLIWVGQQVPVDIAPLAEALGFDNTRNLWVVILFAYTFIASRIPVWMLLQPRDYINSHQLFIALGVIGLGMLVGMNTIAAPVVNDVPDGSPSVFPFLFITIACGAISGFHSLVASGTTAKQVDKDTDSRYIGYMGAVGEGSLATGAVLAVTAGVAATRADWEALYPDFATASGGAVGNFVNGVGVFANNLGVPLDLAVIFAAVVVISFAATTMDTGVRLQRYVVQEIAELAGWHKLARNLTLAGIIAVAVPLAMALLPGGGEAGYTFGVLWQLFGTTNQLTAGLALAVIAVWVTKSGRNATAIVIPLVFLLAMTSWALIVNLKNFVEADDWVLAPLDAIDLRARDVAGRRGGARAARLDRTTDGRPRWHRQRHRPRRRGRRHPDVAGLTVRVVLVRPWTDAHAGGGCCSGDPRYGVAPEAGGGRAGAGRPPRARRHGHGEAGPSSRRGSRPGGRGLPAAAPRAPRRRRAGRRLEQHRLPAAQHLPGGTTLAGRARRPPRGDPVDDRRLAARRRHPRRRRRDAGGGGGAARGRQPGDRCSLTGRDRPCRARHGRRTPTRQR